MTEPSIAGLASNGGRILSDPTPDNKVYETEKTLLFREWHMDRKYAYFLLAISILSEQIGTACLEASKGYTILLFSVLAILLYTITYFIFCKILSEIILIVVSTVTLNLFG